MVLLRFGLLLACAAMALTGCSDQPAARGNVAVKPALQDAAAVAAETAQPFANLVIMARDAAPAPDETAIGRFARRGDCLLFVTDGGKAYNPVIAGAASVGRAPNGEPILSLHRRTIGSGQRIKVSGGGSGDATNLSQAQSRCSDSLFVVGEILDDRI
jgi:hypothetical protein